LLNSAALERWIVTDSRWKMNDPSRLTPDISLIIIIIIIIIIKINVFDDAPVRRRVTDIVGHVER